MATLTMEYSEKNVHERQVLAGLLGSGIISHEIDVNNKGIASFKEALQETMMMSEDIAQNGILGYKTLDDLLNED